MKTRYAVEWCAGIPVDERGDNDLDRADYRVDTFVSLELATAYAQSLLLNGKDAFGEVKVVKQEYRVNQDILEFERMTVYEWVDVESGCIWDVKETPEMKAVMQ